MSASTSNGICRLQVWPHTRIWVRIAQLVSHHIYFCTVLLHFRGPEAKNCAIGIQICNLQGVLGAPACKVFLHL